MKLHRPAVVFASMLTVGPLGLLPPANASEEVVARNPPAPMRYHFELEPHAVLGTAPPGQGQGSGAGLGVRASAVILPNGFIRNGHDSVAIGFGLDVNRYYGRWALNGYQDQCTHFETGPNGTQVCTEVTAYGGTYTYLYLPVVMQWNFWLGRRLSAFGEPGLNLYYLGSHGFSAVPAFYIGGRVQVSNRITLTARLGYPTLAFGLSFML
jgi:hypothetical protein